VSLRAEVVAAAREMLRLGLVAGSSGNVSAREGDLIHITPASVPYDAMREATS
jgi:L-fuculose-phosphate aldolase